MRDVLRALWFARLWSTALVLGLGAASWTLPWPIALAAIVIAVGIEVAAALATAGLLGGLREDRGELMYTNGLRLPIGALRLVQEVEQVELVVGLVLAAVAGVSAWWGNHLTSLIVALAAGMMHLAIGVQRRHARLLTDALLALHDQDPARAMVALRPLLRGQPAIRIPAETYEALAVLQRGDVEDARARLEERWSGALDPSAVTIALLRMYRGDLELADRWLAAERPDDRYQRYLHALVRGNRAVVAGDPEQVFALIEPVLADVPPYYGRELRFLRVAALQRLGRTPEAAAELAAIEPPLQRDPWRALAYPRLWQLATDAAEGRATVGEVRPVVIPRVAKAPGSETGDAFAPPAGDEALTLPLRQRRDVGAIPAEWLAIDMHRSAAAQTILTILGVLLLGLSLFALALLAVGFAFGADPELLLPTVVLVVLGLVFGGALSVGSWERSRRPTRPAVRLSDGRILSSRFWAGGLAPLGVATLILPMGPAALVVYGPDAGGMAYLLTVPLGLLFVLAFVTRTRALRIVRLAHSLPPEQVVAVARRKGRRFELHPVGTRAWLALGLLWSGRPDEAEKELAEAAHLQPEVRELLAWFRAARGEIDLDHLLRRPEPDTLGPEYRHAVTCALAALKVGRPERVLPRISRWTTIADELPNRFGALLHRLVLALLVRAGDSRAEQFRAAHPEVAEADAVEASWPFIGVLPR